MSNRPTPRRPHPDLEIERAVDRALAAGDIDAACRLLSGPERLLQINDAGRVIAWRGYRTIPTGSPGRFLTTEQGDPLLVRTSGSIADEAVYRRVHARVLRAILTRLLALTDGRTP